MFSGALFRSSLHPCQITVGLVVCPCVYFTPPGECGAEHFRGTSDEFAARFNRAHVGVGAWRAERHCF
jgi:hypothetical protein